MKHGNSEIAVVALLRGVNVLGIRKLPMEQLRGVCSSLGFTAPQTYIQSGNVVFKIAAKERASVVACLESAIERTFGFQSDVIVRVLPEMEQIVATNPFANRPEIVPEKLIVVFLASDPGEQARERVRALKVAPEEVFVKGQETFIFYPNGMGRSTLPTAKLEKLLGVRGTARNWNTVLKLLSMARSA